ncbi:D-alanyl-D-alanine carboxypeptidase [Kitasatospora sp. MAP5-34]|uniref:D-alanyl-D-alanine carboxypeptidase family protein n=1 Tax=Kitasatospora sp. MAP5-34 TaxID=3035102 RepID=UPI002474C55D|nr:D-alanyl-D-alanine carboxypeptidase [Kitasatospora sp. MAP5-34]
MDAPPPARSTIGGEQLGLSGVQLAPKSGAPALPDDLTGQSWLVADAGTGEVLASNNAHLRLPPASTLKMLFADTVLPKFDRSTVHRVSLTELAGLGEGSSLVGVKEDLDYRVEDLWRGVFLASGNDAVHVLANMNGGVEQTVTQMQARADAMQAHDTHVISPDGYDNDGQVSSAYDLTLFARAGLRNADFRAYCATQTAQFPGGVDRTTGQRASFGIANTDRLLGKYPGLLGVKNGYTTNAGSTFAGAAERGGRTLLVTVMHPSSYMKVYEETAALLDWGFAAAGKVTPVGRLVDEPATPAQAQAPVQAQSSAKALAATTAATAAAVAARVHAPAAATVPTAARVGTVGWLAAGVCVAAAAAALLRMKAQQRRRRYRTRTLLLAGPVTVPEPVGATALQRR